MKEVLLTLMKTEWADLHHSRIQEWSALGVVTGAHIIVAQFHKLFVDTGVTLQPIVISIVGCLFGLLVTIIGALVTCRHRRLMQIKLNWIYQAELKLGLIKTADNPSGVLPVSVQMPKTREWNDLAWPRFLSVSGLILMFYILFSAFDLSCIILLLILT